MLPHQHLGDRSLRRRPYSFRFRTSLMAAFSSARSASIRFSLAFSASSSRSRFTSDTDAPPYFPRHLKNVALLTPYFRRRSGTGTPLSASFKIPTICVSENFDFRMTAPDRGAVYLQLFRDRGSLRGRSRAGSSRWWTLLRTVSTSSRAMVRSVSSPSTLTALSLRFHGTDGSRPSS